MSWCFSRYWCYISEINRKKCLPSMKFIYMNIFYVYTYTLTLLLLTLAYFSIVWTDHTLCNHTCIHEYLCNSHLSLEKWSWSEYRHTHIESWVSQVHMWLQPSWLNWTHELICILYLGIFPYKWTHGPFQISLLLPTLCSYFFGCTKSSRGMQDLFLVAVYGTLFPDQGWNPGLPALGVWNLSH